MERDQYHYKSNQNLKATDLFPLNHDEVLKRIPGGLEIDNEEVGSVLDTSRSIGKTKT